MSDGLDTKHKKKGTYRDEEDIRGTDKGIYRAEKCIHRVKRAPLGVKKGTYCLRYGLE